MLGDHFLVAGRQNSGQGRHGTRNRGPTVLTAPEQRNMKLGWSTKPQVLTPVIYSSKAPEASTAFPNRTHSWRSSVETDGPMESSLHSSNITRHWEVRQKKKTESLGDRRRKMSPFTLESNWHLCQQPSKDPIQSTTVGGPFPFLAINLVFEESYQKPHLWRKDMH